jgi:hypothetical protein
MTLETRKLTIFKLEPKITKTKKQYWTIETSDGMFSIWDMGLAELIKQKALGNLCEIGIEGKPDSNGKVWYNLVSLEAVIGTGQVQEKKVDIGESAKLRRRTDCMIAAKDLVIAKLVPLTDLLKHADLLVNWVENSPEEKSFKDTIETIKI